MLSNKQIKLISSLQKKKYRDQHQLFIAEGDKLVMDLLHAKTEAAYLIYTKDWRNLSNPLKKYKIEKRIEVESNQLKKISNLKNPSPILGVFHIPKFKIQDDIIQNSLSLLIDDIQDPGNLGTIIRIADWFGIQNVFCSPNTVDLFNPKVIQATMGAISRIKISYTPLGDLIKKHQKENFPIYGTFLEGEIIYKSDLRNKGFIIMGNEGKGISPELQQLVSKKLFIPNYPANQATSESLNVSVACSIICSEFRRR
ncbi:TrmH family RNA methyltransferase [Ancylomarina longa]|uniref:TrmH family RNA methyltransferase n=1 Tax=Ancylomarina longa TaxID=2487017 RepID=UPI001ADE2446|nr:RNA methyltransferase [Ancylomarina longa]